MNTIRRIATSTALVAATLTGTAFVASEAPARSCPKQTQTASDSTAQARQVTRRYRSIESAARAAGVAMTSNRQVIAVMAYPTFVDTRVAAANDRCQIIGALADATSTSTFVWTPKLPRSMASGFGERFVSSSPGVITIEIRATPKGTWDRYVASSPSMGWTSGS